ncbi:hypothetical protein [Sphingomonas mucosissima]|uniref:Uncharacterized protein n=1 Tax=Sphingomonas mucosissima TaxID=370959 RepID=A0A245ZIY1_9SPHN|nr:hypothetical protein [Sphingomonas mucosissima]OWK29698.1 hypothetical protein SPMU_21180 [Sphingomonas mucosissima]
MRIAFLAATAAMLAAPAATAEPLALSLTCPGNGDGREMVRNIGKKEKNDPTYVSRRIPVAGTAQVKINGAEGQILLPRAYVIDGDWRNIRKMMVTDTAIEGRVQIALITSAALSIDRTSGTLTLTSDSGTFVARCTAADVANRAF